MILRLQTLFFKESSTDLKEKALEMKTVRELAMRTVREPALRMTTSRLELALMMRMKKARELDPKTEKEPALRTKRARDLALKRKEMVFSSLSLVETLMRMEMRPTIGKDLSLRMTTKRVKEPTPTTKRVREPTPTTTRMAREPALTTKRVRETTLLTKRVREPAQMMRMENGLALTTMRENHLKTRDKVALEDS